MKLSDYVIEFFEEREVSYLFGYIGGAITHLVDSASRSEKLSFVQVYHEQTASIAAEGYSRESGNIGVAVATSGPGATNMITGIADAFFDSIPTIYLTGQVNTYEYKYSKNIRQQGFQETDIVSIVKPITKYAKLVDKPEDIRYELEKAYFMAKHGRPGPILLDLPMDIQRAEIDPSKLRGFEKAEVEKPSIDFKNIGELIAQSKRPIILAGGGVINAGAEAQLVRFATKHRIPVACSLMGKGSFPEDSELFVGMIGSYGNRCANMIVANADLLLAVGSRLDTRQVGTKLESFVRSGKIIHVDIDNEELENNRIQGRIQINSDAKVFLEEINRLNVSITDLSDWQSYILKTKKKYSQTNEIAKNCSNLAPYDLMTVLNKTASADQIFTVDIGQNQMFASQGLIIKRNQKFFTSGGMAPMGYAMPVAIGASFANKDKKIYAITGDGGFHISTQALMLISQYNLPIKVIILNNSSLGMIVQFQDLYFDSNEVATTREGGYMVPDIKSIADGYGLKYIKINDISKDQKELINCLKTTDAMVIEVDMGGKTTVTPKLEVNCPIENMSPKLSDGELRESMLIEPFSETKK